MKEKTMKVANDEYLQLEDARVHGDLIDIKTSKNYRKEMISRIKSSLGIYNKNPEFEHLKKELVDVAIVIYVTKYKYDKQDLDNVAKIVLDALTKRNKEDPSYLLENDNQVIRLLLYKKQRGELDYADTSQMSVSIRKHNISKDMKLVAVNVI